MRIKFFEHIIIGAHEYKLVGSNYRGSSFVCSLQNINNKDDELVIKINTKRGAEERFEQEIKFLSENKSSYFPKLLKDGYINYIDPDNSSNNTSYRYFVMPKYEENLTDYMKRKVGDKKRLKLYIKICKAILKLHDKGIIHRDIKPDNILINKNSPIICDFGIAKFPNFDITEPSDRLANSNYCAPEQRKQPYPPFGKYTDVYPLGLILNELFTGKLMNGSNYLRIQDTSPSYAIFDDLVSTMTENDYKKRENDLFSVIYQIDQFVSERNHLESVYTAFMAEASKVNRRNKIIRMLSDDCICLYYLSKKLNDFSSLNVYHHNNIHCRINDQFVISEVVLSAIEKELDIIFNNENKRVVEFYENNKKIENCEKTVYLEFCTMIAPFSDKKTSIECSRIKRKFLCLQSYRAQKFLDNAKRTIDEITSHLEDSPIFYLAYLVDKYSKDTVIVSRIGYFVEPIMDKSSPDPENIEIFNSRQDEKILIKNRLLKIFNNKITINVSNYEFSVLFKTKSSFKRFVCMCREYQESLDPNDVLIIDVDDILDFQDIYKRNTILYLMPSTIGILPRVLDYYELKTR